MAVSGSIQGLYAAENPDVDDPLVDLFVKKGFVTQDEAEKVKAEAALMRINEMQMPPLPQSKWDISAGIKSVQLFGDVRMRYENRGADDPGNGEIDLQRWRYAVRLGLRGEVLDDFYYGLRLETGSNPRSSFVTMGTAAATSSSSPTYQGPFGKSTAGINLGQAYIGWHPWNWLDVTAGKMPNPLSVTPLVWNSNINPEGAAEHLKYTVGEADFFANLGQFIYQDTNPNQASFGYFTGSTSDVYTGGKPDTLLLAFQGGMNYRVTPRFSLKASPVFYIYSGLGANTSPGTPGFSDAYVGQGANASLKGFDQYPGGYYGGFNANQTGINNLEVLEIPFEVNFKVARLDARLFGDLAYNLDGAARAQAAYNVALAESLPTFTLPNGSIPNYPTTPISSPQTHDVKAYQIGFDIGSRDSLGLVNGSVSKKNAWELKTYWQHIEQYSLDPNLLDTDFFEGVENLQGIYVAAAYGFSDNIIGTFRYGHASRINNRLGTGGSGQDIPQMNPINNFDLYQVDLTFKF
jgi:hypothetical protein